MELNKIFQDNVANTTIIFGVFASPLNKGENKFKKITVRPIKTKESVIYQFEKFDDKKAYHENVNACNTVNRLLELSSEYKNINLFTLDGDYQVLVSKKGNAKIIKKPPTKQLEINEHNKSKQYIIPDNKPCDFLIELGVMNKDGKVLSKKYDKFRQINKYLEIVEDAIEKTKIGKNYRIIDFGCGKAYLTFALYYYFNTIKGVNVQITGLDLKKDVINFCNLVAEKLNYNNLKFENGDIVDYNTNLDVDMVVTLHACDNATDAALLKAIKWNSKVILSVPCCQHEFYDKIYNENIEAMLGYGLIKERMASLVTDTLRCLYLEANGYKTQMVEFVSMDHTPKNILIRAVQGKSSDDAVKKYNDFKQFWNLNDLFIERKL